METLHARVDERPKDYQEALEKELFDGSPLVRVDIDDADNPDFVRDAELLNGIQGLDDLKSFDNGRLGEVFSAAERLGLVAPLDQAHVEHDVMRSEVDQRMVFRQGDDYFTVSDELYHDEITTEEARNLVKLQMILLGADRQLRLYDPVRKISQNLENYKDVLDSIPETDVPVSVRNNLKAKLDEAAHPRPRGQGQRRHIPPRSFDQNFNKPLTQHGETLKRDILTAIQSFSLSEKARLAELYGDVRKVEDHEATTKAIEESADEITESVEALDTEFEKMAEEKKSFRNLPLEEKIQQVLAVKLGEGGPESEHGVKAEIFKIVTRAVDGERDLSGDLRRHFGRLKGGIDSYGVETFRNHAIEVLAKSEVAKSQAETGGFSFDEARLILESGALDQETLMSTLNGRDLGAFCREVYLEHPELFGAGQLTENQQIIKQRILDQFSEKAKKNVFENLREVPLKDEVPFGEINDFLNNSNPNIGEISHFLGGQDFVALYEVFDHGREHFDAQGHPIDDEGRQLVAPFFERAREVAEENEYLAVEKETTAEFDNSPVGKLINQAMDTYDGIMAENRTRHWREAFAGGKDWREKLATARQYIQEGETRQTKKERYIHAEQAKSQLESFRRNYLTERGRLTASLNEFQRDVNAKIEEAGGIENLSQRTLNSIRRQAARLMLTENHVDAKLVEGALSFEGDPAIVANYDRRNPANTFREFVAKSMPQRESWIPSSEIKRDEAAYENGVKAAKRAFVREMENEGVYGPIINAAAGDNDGNINIRRLTNRFNSEHSNGAMEFAAEVRHNEQLMRARLREAIAGREPRKVIDLIDGLKVNDRLKAQSIRNFELEVKKFAKGEEWRLRFERASRRFTGSNEVKLEKLSDVFRTTLEAFENEDSHGFFRIGFTFSVSARHAALTGCEGLVNAWHNSAEGICSACNIVAPYSEGLRDGIRNCKKRKSEVEAARTERRKRLERLGAGSWNRGVGLSASERARLERYGRV